MSESKLQIDWLGGNAPVQGEGTVAGRPFYFRARGQRWSFAVTEEPGADPASIWSVEDAMGSGFYMEGEYGERPFEASWMPEEDARRIIEECAAVYLSHRGG
jgi:hypothetical protein